MALHDGLRPALLPLARRGPPADCHPGVWLDHFLPQQTFAEDRQKLSPGYNKDHAREHKAALMRQIAALHASPDYQQALNLWRDGLAADPARIAFADGQATGRVIIGIGQKGPAECGITLHHTWGVPVLPGSSLKGIAALGADRWLAGPEWRRRNNHAEARKDNPNAYDALFGDVEEQGAVIFHDAWFKPEAGKQQQNGIHHDVVTVHHPDYYQERGQDGPSDTDSPIPIPFLSVSGTFVIALELNPALDPAQHGHWLEAAWTALQAGLRHHGIGAKTNAGYGRIALGDFDATSTGKAISSARLQREAAEAAEREARRRQDLLQRRGALPDAAARITDVLSAEGRPGLVGWLRGNGSPELAGVPFDREHVSAAAALLSPLPDGAALGAAFTGNAKTWWQAFLSRPGRLSDGELVAILQPFLQKKDWNGAAEKFSKSRLDSDSLERAIRLLEAQDGIKPGHLKKLRDLKPS